MAIARQQLTCNPPKSLLQDAPSKALDTNPLKNFLKFPSHSRKNFKDIFYDPSVKF